MQAPENLLCEPSVVWIVAYQVSAGSTIQPDFFSSENSSIACIIFFTFVYV